MSDEENGANGDAEPKEQARRGSIKDGIRQGLGMLTAMKDAIEATINEAKERGDLTPERAKEVMRSTLEKAQEKAGEAREALDFVKQKEFDVLNAVVDRLKTRVADIEREMGGDPGKSEESVSEDKEGS